MEQTRPPEVRAQDKMPLWLMQKDVYRPPADREHFLNKTILEIVARLCGLREEAAATGRVFFSASFRVFCTILLIFLISFSHTLLFLLVNLSCLLIYLCFLSGRHILMILKPALSAAVFSFLVMLPAAFWGWSNIFMLPLKVFLTTAAAAVLARRTPFHSITKALGGLHIPGLFIMAIDLTVKYIVLLGNTAYDLLIALKLRSVGKNRRKYQSLGSVMGMTFIKAQEYARDTHDAMMCRCFTGDYHVSQEHHMEKRHIVYAAAVIALTVIFLYTEGYL